MNSDDYSAIKKEYIFFIAKKELQVSWYVRKCQDWDIDVRQWLGDLRHIRENV